MCATHLQLDVAASSRARLLDAISSHFGIAFVDQPKKDEATPLYADPLAEAVFDDIDKSDQMEFPEVNTVFKQQRERQRVAAWRVTKGFGTACKNRKAVASKAKLCKRRRVGPIDEAPLDGGPDAVVGAVALEGPGVPDGFDQAVIAEPEPAAPEAGFVVAPCREGPAIAPPPVVVDIVLDGPTPGPAAAPMACGCGSARALWGCTAVGHCSLHGVRRRSKAIPIGGMPWQ